MYLIHILAASCLFLVGLLLRMLYLIVWSSGHMPTENSRRHPIRIMIILGSGGHTTEMLRIVSNMNSERYSPRIYVRASTDTISESKVRNLEGDATDYQLIDVRRSREVHQSYLESFAMDITCLFAKDFLLSEALMMEIESNSPPEIRVHLAPICRELWASMSSTETMLTYKWLQDATVTLEACLDRTWESLNSGCWKEVSIRYKYCYTFCTIVKSALLLAQHNCKDMPEKSKITLLKILEDTILLIDKGILLGAPPLSDPELLTTVACKMNSFIHELKEKKCSKLETMMTFRCCALPGSRLSELALVVHYHQPSMETFYRDIFRPKAPAILEGCMEHWKALELWRDPEYLLKVAGVRTVPIEIGSRYTAEDWTQRLLTFSEFIESYVTSDTSPKLGYLAQHELFNQIPELMDDIAVPDYCNFTDSGSEAKPPDINAWLGPKGTISPLHFDPKNNLLCQVFGHKEVVLFHPRETPNLYPYATKLLTNTARVDPTRPDFQKWPKFEKAIGMTCALGPGEMLFIPPGWWHHVTALSQSFSVSFWWD